MSTLPQTSPGRTGGAPSAKAERPRRRPVASSNGKPLSNRQKAAISQTAAAAFLVQDRAGLVEEKGSDTARCNAWRHSQQKAAGFPASLRDCGNNHYRGLMAHFLCLAGKDDSAFRYQMRTGRVKDHGAIEDTHENRETQRKLIMDELLAHGHRCDPAHADHDPDTAAKVLEKGAVITAGYVIALAKGKCKGRSLDSLTARELSQILWTLKNRIAAREGRGSTATRNKTQSKSAIERRREAAIARGDWSDKKQRAFEKRRAAALAKKGAHAA